MKITSSVGIFALLFSLAGPSSGQEINSAHGRAVPQKQSARDSCESLKNTAQRLTCRDIFSQSGKVATPDAEFRKLKELVETFGGWVNDRVFSMATHPRLGNDEYIPDLWIDFGPADSDDSDPDELHQFAVSNARAAFAVLRFVDALIEERDVKPKGMTKALHLRRRKLQIVG